MNADLDNDRVTIDLGAWCRGASELTVENVITTLEETTTLEWLNIYEYEHDYDPTPENNRRFVEPLCRCIANLRSSNNYHLLGRIRLGVTLDANAMEQFLIAAKEFGIREMCVSGSACLPVHFIGDFCRNNNQLKILEILGLTFKDVEGAGIVGPSTNDGMLDSAVIVTLDKLTLHGIHFKNSTSVTNFTKLLAHMNMSELELGDLHSAYVDDKLMEGIVSRMQLPTAEQLILRRECEPEHFKATLEAGMSSMTQLEVAINFDEGDAIEKKNLLSTFLRGAVKLNSLTIRFYSDTRNWQPPVLFCAEALKPCITITTIQVFATTLDDDSPDHIHHINQNKLRELQLIAARNVELGRFVANPSTYPTEDLYYLMSQFDNCPSGLYTLSCHLPAVFSFDKLRAPQLKKKRKLDDMEETNGNLLLENAQLRALIPQQPEERAALFPNGNEARIGDRNLLDNASNNGAGPESVTLPQAQVIGNATADETPPEQPGKGTVEK